MPCSSAVLEKQIPTEPTEPPPYRYGVRGQVSGKAVLVLTKWTITATTLQQQANRHHDMLLRRSLPSLLSETPQVLQS